MTCAEVAAALGTRADAWRELQPQCDVNFSILTLIKKALVLTCENVLPW
jgi:hypothetical protein